MTSTAMVSVSPWRRCRLCRETTFKSPQEFKMHIRQNHCKKEGGSYVCSYGHNNVCSSLPLEGVSERDYEFHVAKHHVLAVADDEKKVDEEEFMDNLCQKYQHILSSGQENQPNVVVDQYKWTIYDSTLILPSVLNDPRRTKREGDLFTKSWGDGFVEHVSLPFSPYIVNVEPVHFEAYLKHAKKRMQHHSRKALSRRRSDQRKGSISGLPLLQNSVGESSNEIEDVPKVFMQAEFHLEHPEVFNSVLPWSQLYGHSSKDKTTGSCSSVKLLQEKMSYYLDLVEVQIAKHISMRSEAFFHAMTSHDALMDQLTNVIKSVSALRERIHTIEDDVVKVPMRVMRLKMKQGNYIQVYNKLKLMATVHQTQPTIQLLLSTSDFVGALDLIFTTQDMLVQELAGIRSFRHLSSQLAEMEKLIGKMMHTDFLRYVTADLNRPPTEMNVMEEDRLIAILFGMLWQNQFSFIQAFKEECYTAIDAAVKQSVIEVISEADDSEIENSTGNLTQQLQSLNFITWLELLKLALKNLNFLLTRIQALYVIMDEVTDIASGHLSKSAPPNSSHCRSLQLLDGEVDVIISERDYLKLKMDLKKLICAVCDHAHDCCANILSAKLQDGSLDKLATSDFVALAKGIEHFQDHCESICGKQSIPLRLALQNQAIRFASRFHDERKMKLSLLLENELWKQADVPMDFQDLVDQIISTSLITFLKNSSSGHFHVVDRKPQPHIVISSEKFTVVGTVLMLLKMVIEYCQCAEDVPMLALDLAYRLADLLKVFSSRTSELVLCAGALQLVGLKTITAKHLALASRCLKLLTLFLPQVKDHFCDKVPSKQAAVTKQFDNILKVYYDLIAEINNKMETIISDLFEVQLCQWEVKAPVPSSCFRSICKHICKLHEVLVDLLPPEELKNIFLRVNNMFKAKLRGHLTRLQINIDEGQQHGIIIQELTFYTQNLKKLNMQFDFNMNDLWQ